MCKKVKDGIILFYENTHGRENTLKYFIFKVLWLLSLLSCILICIFLVIESVLQYYKFEVATEIRDVFPNNLAFPVITICNANPLGTPRANSIIRKYYLDKYNVNITGGDHFLALLDNQTIQDENDYIFYTTYDPNFNGSLREVLGYNSVFLCQMNEQDCNETRDFKSYYDATYGYCKRFNSGENNNKRVLAVDSKNDLLRLIVFLGPTIDSKNLYDSLTNGLMISVDDQRSYPISLKKGIAVKPGSIAQMYYLQKKDIRKTRVTKKPMPYSKCVSKKSIKTNLSQEMSRLNMHYSRANCLILCQQKQNIDQIGCYDMRLPRIFDAPPCNDQTSYNQLKSVTFKNSLCIDLCPQECQTVYFDVSTSYLDFPTYLTYRYLVMNNIGILSRIFKTENITYEMFRKSFAAVNVYFNEIKMTEMEESEAMTFVELISDIGGTMGLFISFSILGLIEFVEVIVEAAVLTFRTNPSQIKRI